MDTVSPQVRSRMMAGIRGRDTQPALIPELVLALGLTTRMAATSARTSTRTVSWPSVVLAMGAKSTQARVIDFILEETIVEVLASPME